MKTFSFFVLFLAHALAGDRYMVEYATSEPCYECGYRNAVWCPDTPTCGVPYKNVPHTKTFDTKEQAIAFLNAGMRDSHSLEAAVNGTSASSQVVTFRGLYRLSEIPVEVNKTSVTAVHTTETEVHTYQEKPSKH